jgi:hypothetical protein
MEKCRACGNEIDRDDHYCPTCKEFVEPVSDALDQAVELILEVIDGNNLSDAEIKKLNEAITLIDGD